MQKQRPHELLSMLWFDKKVYLMFMIHRFFALSPYIFPLQITWKPPATITMTSGKLRSKSKQKEKENNNMAEGGGELW